VTEPSPPDVPPTGHDDGPGPAMPRRAAPTVRREELVEVLHGHEVADPYRWLEAPATDPRIQAFVRAQNDHTAAHLDALPARGTFREQLGRLWDHPRRGAPWRRGSHWFQVRNDGLQDQDVLWTAPAPGQDATPPAPGQDAAAPPGARGIAPPDHRWRVLLDPNGWSADGTASLSALSVRPDGELVAFARSDAGSDWLVWRVVEVRTGDLRPDEVRWARFSSAAWLPDGSGFLYGAYDPPEPGQEHAAALRNQRLRRHLLGSDPAEDPVVHERPDQPELGFDPHVSHDGRWLVLTVWRGTDPTNRVHVAPFVDGEVGDPHRLLDAADASYQLIGVHGDELVVWTDHDAPLGRVLALRLPPHPADGPPGDHGAARVVAADPDTDERTSGERGGQRLPASDLPPHRELVAEERDRLERVVLVGGETSDEPAWLVCARLHHATARVAVHDATDGRHLEEVALPGLGTVPAITGGRSDRSIHLTFETFTAPAAVLHHDLERGATTTVTAPAAPAADHLTVEQVHVHHAGIAVPLFLVHRRDVTPDGAVPTVLWGYGGFDISVTPGFRPGWRAWVDAGGLLAVACLRGGGEYGRAWADDGRLARKEHVFDDALACAAWLTGRRRDTITATTVADGAPVEVTWTAPAHLGIEGRSNGGLLAAACLTREPTAFGSVVPEVGVLDLTRFHRFTIGWAWTSDYGSPDDPDDLAVLLRYSPYHRVQPGTHYPPVLLTTGDTDDRVVPAHSYKFAAALQHAQAGPAPVLLRVDVSAGHGAGKPVGKLLDERADVLAFHAHHLGLHPLPMA
jgi:prolyl oligopeptidase